MYEIDLVLTGFAASATLGVLRGVGVSPGAAIAVVTLLLVFGAVARLIWQGRPPSLKLVCVGGGA